MNYLIDYDTRSVECKSADREVLENYVRINNLELATCIVSEEDDLIMEMSFKEMSDLFHNLSERPRKFESEEEAAELVFAMLQTHQNEFPNYTKQLGKKLLKAGEKRSSDSAKGKSTSTKPKPAKATTGASKTPQKRLKLEGDEAIVVVDGKCKKGSILDTIVTAINVEMCDSAQEIADYITANHVIPKTGELADEKFAWHNIKYFIKQGKLEIDDL